MVAKALIATGRVTPCRPLREERPGGAGAATGGTFSTYLSRLVSNGLATRFPDGSEAELVGNGLPIQCSLGIRGSMEPRSPLPPKSCGC